MEVGSAKFSQPEVDSRYNKINQSPKCSWAICQKWLKHKSKKQPGIYVHYLVYIETQQAPSPNEMMRILNGLANYNKEQPTSRALNEYAAKVDTAVKGMRWNGKQSLDGERKYGGEEDRCVALFIEEVQERLDYLDNKDEPMESGFCRVGFSANPVLRIIQHKSHTDQSLFYLVDAISRIEFPGRFEMKAYTVCLVPTFEQCSTLERLISRACQAFFMHGSGFVFEEAGLGLGRAAPDILPAVWQGYEKELESDEAYLKRLEAEESLLCQQWPNQLQDPSNDLILEEAIARQEDELNELCQNLELGYDEKRDIETAKLAEESAQWTERIQDQCDFIEKMRASTNEPGDPYHEAEVEEIRRQFGTKTPRNNVAALLPGWEQRSHTTKSGLLRVYYVDHINKRTTYVDPRQDLNHL